MKPTIAIVATKGVKLSRRLREYVSHRLSRALDRKHYSIQAMKVRISDQNGPRGGIDKQCQIQLTLNGLPTVVITEKGSDVAAMVNQAAHRAAQAIERLLARTRSIAHTKYLAPALEPAVI
ncbi:sigma 54 modulation/S30EA-like ribosomal protein [Collimonas sp. PA-H2]|uniref:HPF/RaiA family ribosome-associated protein n=1 Tax=Collimonas sp. PA-H2 TaxID=1881062 RepID=UPI000C00FCD3|nr:HPF/RaiA family ribosome-associated protein [Collimonas sp. PA-H2]PFH11282.1 sigma 54 modulation/S30EA-like ribosomal protein [Collimonas sp. PA-H2]